MEYAKRVKGMKTRKEEVEIEEGKKDACYKKVKSRYSVWAKCVCKRSTGQMP